ncbi:MAG: BrnT family toxin [Verrucomicrobiota bacterium JB023]|nr:BrnT family toxin [Verrucomicrobiota bacterium JB023]
MELDLLDVAFDTKATRPREIEEALEDPFAVRLLPENERSDGESRFYALGKTISNRYLFLCFSTDGKKARVVAAREMTETEQAFYDRKFFSEFK